MLHPVHRERLVWPAQRLRWGWALVLGVVFDAIASRLLPPLVLYTALGLGVASLASATTTIWALRSSTRALMEDDEE